jgi:FkbM family methyltransferase
VYRLVVDDSRRIVLRHRSRDVEIFDEIFRSEAYRPPLEVQARLGAIRAERPLRILDLGGNIGLFSVDALIRYPSSEVTSYEPDPVNLLVITECIRLNPASWTLVEAAATTAAEPVTFASGYHADSRVSDVGIQVPAVDILEQIHGFDYVKMDVEGSEWRIFDDPRWPVAMRSVSALALEWHLQDGSELECRDRAVAACNAAGLKTIASPPLGLAHGTLWGWR